MSKPTKALYTKDFLLATIASVFVGGYSILLLTLTLMYGNDAGFTAAADDVYVLVKITGDYLALLGIKNLEI